MMACLLLRGARRTEARPWPSIDGGFYLGVSNWAAFTIVSCGNVGAWNTAVNWAAA